MTLERSANEALLAAHAETKQLKRQLEKQIGDTLRACQERDAAHKLTDALRIECGNLRADCGTWQLECARLEAIIANYKREFGK